MSVVRLVSRTLSRAGQVPSKPSVSIQTRFLSGLHGSRIDPSQMWNVGSFPRLDKESSVFDTTGMLSSLPDPFPMFGFPTVPEIIGDMGSEVEYHADSILRKRRKKMNKHKHKKRKKALRNRTKKN